MKVIFYLVVFAALFVAYIRYVENKGVFFPARPLAATPEDLGIPFEDVTMETQDHIKIHGWVIKAPAAKSTVVFLHGNAGNIGDRLGKIGLFHQIGVNVLIIDYRGYGTSAGHPTERGVYKDALAAYDYLISRGDIDNEKIVGYGASLGGAVAVDLASKRGLAALIVDSSFSSVTDMAKRIYPFVPSFLINTKFDSEAKIRNIQTPQLFIHSVDDEVVPIALGKKLYAASVGPKEFIEINGGHNDGHVVAREKIRQGISRFLRNLDLL